MNKKSNAQAKTSKESLKEKLSRVLDIPSDVFPGTVSVYMRGRNCLEILGSGRMVCYNKNEIRLLTREGALVIKGERLFCSTYRKGAVNVRGKIASIEFAEE